MGNFILKIVAIFCLALITAFINDLFKEIGKDYSTFLYTMNGWISCMIINIENFVE